MNCFLIKLLVIYTFSYEKMCPTKLFQRKKCDSAHFYEGKLESGDVKTKIGNRKSGDGGEPRATSCEFSAISYQFSA